ncbi:MAG: aminopeptidase P family protein, partial [Acidimicrobiia bacterium]
MRTGDHVTGHRYRARIGPEGRAASLNWHVLGPGEPALSEWAALGLELPDLEVIRRYRLERVREQLARFDYAGIVLFDPLNVRYATDSTNMQVWVLHNA